MAVEFVIVALLKGLSALTALVSTRVYLDRLPQTPTYPCVRVTMIDDIGDYHLRGGSGVKSARIQVDAYAREVSGVDPYALAAAVAAAVDGDDAGSGLSGFQGGIGSPPFEFCSIERVDRRRSYDPEELRVLVMSQDYRVTYRA